MDRAVTGATIMEKSQWWGQCDETSRGLGRIAGENVYPEAGL